MTRILGAVFAGGKSRRFGSDKCVALLNGRPLIEHAVDRVGRHCADLVVCGRDDGRWRCLPDCPCSGLGPLGGLSAALAHAAEGGFDAVLSVPCDVPDIPDTLFALLTAGRGAAYVAALPVVGYWPAAFACDLDALLAESADRSLRHWAARIGAIPVETDSVLSNVNTVEDLTALRGGSEDQNAA